MKTLIIIAVAIFAFIAISFVYKKKRKAEPSVPSKTRVPSTSNILAGRFNISTSGYIPGANNLQVQTPTAITRTPTANTRTPIVAPLSDDPSTDWNTVAAIISTSPESLNNLKLLVAKEKVLLDKGEFWGYRLRVGNMQRPYQRLIYEVAYSITREGMDKRIIKATTEQRKAELLIEQAGLQNSNLYLKDNDVKNLKNIFEYGN